MVTVTVTGACFFCGGVFASIRNNRTVKCQYREEKWDIWALENRSSLCRPITTPSTGEFLTVMTPDLTTVSVGIPFVSVGVLLPPKTSTHESQFVETAVTSEAELGAAPESETGCLASLLSWNVNTLTVFVILLITHGGTVFVFLIAVKYIVKRGKDHRTQHDIQTNHNHVTAFSSIVPLLNTQLKADITRQHAGCEKRSSYSVGGTEYHVYERID
jgi:hypothetical protein